MLKLINIYVEIMTINFFLHSFVETNTINAIIQTHILNNRLTYFKHFLITDPLNFPTIITIF